MLNSRICWFLSLFTTVKHWQISVIWLLLKKISHCFTNLSSSWMHKTWFLSYRLIQRQWKFSLIMKMKSILIVNTHFSIRIRSRRDLLHLIGTFIGMELKMHWLRIRLVLLIRLFHLWPNTRTIILRHSYSTISLLDFLN